MKTPATAPVFPKNPEEPPLAAAELSIAVRVGWAVTTTTVVTPPPASVLKTVLVEGAWELVEVVLVGVSEDVLLSVVSVVEVVLVVSEVASVLVVEVVSEVVDVGASEVVVVGEVDGSVDDSLVVSWLVVIEVVGNSIGTVVEVVKTGPVDVVIPVVVVGSAILPGILSL